MEGTVMPENNENLTVRDAVVIVTSAVVVGVAVSTATVGLVNLGRDLTSSAVAKFKARKSEK